MNYIGSADRETMLLERPVLQKTVMDICDRHGFTLDRNPGRHAGGKMVWRYPSALGQKGNLEIDLNFIYRIPLWPIEFKSSCVIGSKQIHNVPVLDLHELSAGKLSALIDRKTGRDLFDAHYLLTKTNLDRDKLRLALVIYSAISRKADLRKLTPQSITVDITDLNNRLIPLIRKKEIEGMNDIANWAAQMVQECQQAFEHFLPLNNNEHLFLQNLLDKGIVEPELITADQTLIDNIKNHPAIRWSAQQYINN